MGPCLGRPNTRQMPGARSVARSPDVAFCTDRSSRARPFNQLQSAFCGRVADGRGQVNSCNEVATAVCSSADPRSSRGAGRSDLQLRTALEAHAQWVRERANHCSFRCKAAAGEPRFRHVCVLCTASGAVGYEQVVPSSVVALWYASTAAVRQS